MQGKEVDSDDILFNVPFSLLVSGPTSSGKTYWVYNFLKNYKDMVKSGSSVPQKILFCYSVDQPLYGQIKGDVNNVIFHEGLPSLEVIYEMSGEEPLLVVLDDLIHKIVDNHDMLLLFTQGSHHRNISVIFMTQNLYHSGKNARTIALNVKYLVLFANPRDTLQIKYLGRQLFSHKAERLYEAYLDAIKMKKWGYLLVDLNHDTPDWARLRTNFFPADEGHVVVYELVQ